MERGLSVGHVAAVGGEGDLITELLLSEGQCGVVPYNDDVVNGTAGVILGPYRRKRRRCDRGGPRHCEQNHKCMLCSVGAGE